jgi:PBP1b-binding outer membrane lipoprotein LpoB
MLNKQFKRLILVSLAAFFSFSCQKQEKSKQSSFKQELQDSSVPIQFLDFDTIDIEPSHNLVLDMD